MKITTTLPVDQQFFSHNLSNKEKDVLERDREAITRLIARKYFPTVLQLRIVEEWITRVEAAIVGSLPFSSKERKCKVCGGSRGNHQRFCRYSKTKRSRR